MEKILLFEEYLNQYFGGALNEASYEDLGFAAILGSTDKQNLGDAASKIGIEKNATYTVDFKSIQDLIDIGTKKSFEGFTGLTKGDVVGDKIDFISISSKGETKEIDPKVSAEGNIILDFDNSGMKVKAANNGMLALARACSAASQVFGKGGVDPQKVKGKILISMGNSVSGDSSRNAAFLAVSNEIGGNNDNLRIGKEKYTGMWFPRIESSGDKIASAVLESKELTEGDPLLEQESIKDGSSLVKLVGDSLADAFRAAIFQYESERRNVFPNNSGAYGGFKSIYLKISEIEKIKEAKPSPKKISPVVLATQMQTAIQRLSQGYPMKKSNVDMIPAAKEILKKLGNSKSTKLDHTDLEDVISQFKPEKYEKIPQFNPVLGEFWKSVTSAVVIRAASTFAKNVKEPMIRAEDAEGREVGGGEKSGEKKNVSGGV
jgi:hypothetical protein